MSIENGVVVCSVLEPDVDRAMTRVAEVPAACELVELRADDLRLPEVEAIVRRSGRAVMVTVRRECDGGSFSGSEAERREMLLGALAADARYIDVEWDSDLRELACGETSDRVVLSQHGGPCNRSALAKTVEQLTTTPAAKLKLVPQAESIRDVLAVREILQAQADDRRLACFAMGGAGSLSRILAIAWGSWATYGRPVGGVATAAGQIRIDDLLGLYDVCRIGASTRLFALIGQTLSSSPSPSMHRAGYLEAGIDARYIPIEFEQFAEFVGLPEALGLTGFAVTMPFKRKAAEACQHLEPLADDSQAVNTVLIRPDGWHGFNTDGPAVVEAIHARMELTGLRASILGAGGTALAVGAALRDAGVAVRLFNRDHGRALAAGRRLNVEAGPLGEWPGSDWNIAFNATPLGRAGETVLSVEQLVGQIVVDAAYAQETTPLVRDARQAGLEAVDGFEMLLGQALLQFRLMTGAVPNRETMAQAGIESLGCRGECVE